MADDKFADVITILEQRGWIRSPNADSPNFLLKWRNLSNINFRLLRKDQFVNHVLNSQQLSNKVLLNQHLAFHQHHHHQHRDHMQTYFDENNGNMVEASVAGGTTKAKSPALQSDVDFHTLIPNGRQRNSDDGTGSGDFDIVGNAKPEVFFPRCWNVSDDEGVSSLLKMFSVSASVALLRSVVDNEDFANTGARQGSNHNEPGKDDHSEAVAAAISITSRYIASLRRRRRGDEDSPCNLFGDAENTREHGTATTSGQQRTDCCGQDAADASITIGNPEWLAVLKTWETAVVASQEESRVGLMPRGSDGSTGAKEVDGAVDMRQDTFSNDEKNTVCPENARENIITLGNSLCPEFVTQARAMLQELDAVDPQCTLLGRANAWVVKPPGLSCGRGITATSSLRGLLAACRELKWKAVVQKYVERPLVVQGFKFDIRQWVLVTSCNPLVLWGFDEGYVRFSSRPFSMDPSRLSDKFIHLCNHSVQKEGRNAFAGAESIPYSYLEGEPLQESGVGNSGEKLDTSPSLPLGAQGHMWSVDQLRRYLTHHFKNRDIFGDVVLPRIRSVVVQTLLSVREVLQMTGRGMEWLGFDLILTEDLRVMLIEVNVSPDLSHSTPITARLVPPATEDALRLLLDDGETDARIASSLGSFPQPPIAPPPSAPSLPPPSRPTSPHQQESAGQVQGWEAGKVGKAAAVSGIGGQEGGGMFKGGREHCLRDGGNDRQQCVGGQLRWRLWHRGKEEPLASLLKLRDAKKAWFLSRRQPQRQCVAQNNDCSSCYVQKHSRDELLVDCGAVLGERVRINGAHSGAINILEGEGERSVLCRSSDEDEL